MIHTVQFVIQRTKKEGHGSGEGQVCLLGVHVRALKELDNRVASSLSVLGTTKLKPSVVKPLYLKVLIAEDMKQVCARS